MEFIRDVLKSGKSKRVIAATLTAFFIATADELGVSQDAALAISALVVSLIIGDSLRSVSDKGTSNGQT